MNNIEEWWNIESDLLAWAGERQLEEVMTAQRIEDLATLILSLIVEAVRRGKVERPQVPEDYSEEDYQRDLDLLDDEND